MARPENVTKAEALLRYETVQATIDAAFYRIEAKLDAIRTLEAEINAEEAMIEILSTSRDQLEKWADED